MVECSINHTNAAPLAVVSAIGADSMRAKKLWSCGGNVPKSPPREFCQFFETVKWVVDKRSAGFSPKMHQKHFAVRLSQPGPAGQLTVLSTAKLSQPGPAGELTVLSRVPRGQAQSAWTCWAAYSALHGQAQSAWTCWAAYSALQSP